MKRNPAARAIGGAAQHDPSQTTDSPQETNPSLRRSPGFVDAQETLDRPPGQLVAHKGRFHVLRPHAEGGLGRVFVAYDTEVGREVALKEIKIEKCDDFDSRDRFTREAEITGNLEHPGVVPVYGQGAYPDGRPYYAMRFIRGISLKDAIEAYHRQADESQIEDANVSYKFDLRRLVKRLIDVCQTMQYAHSRGVLHRDLKPGNIMLGPYGETLVVAGGLGMAAAAQFTTQPARADEIAAAGGLKPGMVLNQDTWQQAEGLLPPEILKHYKSGEYSNPIVEWKKEHFNWPPDFLEASKQNEGKFGVDENGTIIDLKTGTQKKGAVALWIDRGTMAHFRNVSIQPASKP